MSDKNCIFEYHRQVRQRKIFRELNALVFPNRAKRSHSIFVCFARNNNQRSLKVVQAKQTVANVDPVFEHAARQLARPMQELGLAVTDLASKVYPSTEDRQRGQEFLRDLPRPLVVFHPGSGSKRKNWLLENWIDVGNRLLGLDDFQGSLIIVSGEAHEDRTRRLRAIWKNERVRFARNIPLPELATLFG